MDSDEIDLYMKHLKNYTFRQVLGKGKQGVVYEGVEDHNR